MSLIKNLRRQEIEIFGAKRVVRNASKKEEPKEEIKAEKSVKKTKKSK